MENKDSGQIAFEASDDYGHGLCPWSSQPAAARIVWEAIERAVRIRVYAELEHNCNEYGDMYGAEDFKLAQSNLRNKSVHQKFSEK